MPNLQEINWLVFALVWVCLFLAGIGAALLAIKMHKDGTTKGRLALLTHISGFGGRCPRSGFHCPGFDRPAICGNGRPGIYR